MSGDPQQEYFADGITEDIITELSRMRRLFVIARNSTFTYKGRTVDVKQVASELGVRYVMTGNVRRTAKRVRVAAQLHDAETGLSLWGETAEGTPDDLFESRLGTSQSFCDESAFGDRLEIDRDGPRPLS
jgi:TolB-like protein